MVKSITTLTTGTVEWAWSSLAHADATLRIHAEGERVRTLHDQLSPVTVLVLLLP